MELEDSSVLVGHGVLLDATQDRSPGEPGRISGTRPAPHMRLPSSVSVVGGSNNRLPACRDRQHLTDSSLEPSAIDQHLLPDCHEAE